MGSMARAAAVGAFALGGMAVSAAVAGAASGESVGGQVPSGAPAVAVAAHGDATAECGCAAMSAGEHRFSGCLCRECARVRESGMGSCCGGSGEGAGRA